MSHHWQAVGVPPLRADIDRRKRAHRRHLSKIERRGWLTLAGLLSLTSNVLLYHALLGGFAP